MSHGRNPMKNLHLSKPKKKNTASVKIFAECDKYYKDPKATQDDFDLCRIKIYEKDPDGVREKADSFELDDVVGSYWNQGEGFKAIELRDKINFRDDEEEEGSPDLDDLLENIARVKFELADYYINAICKTYI